MFAYSTVHGTFVGERDHEDDEDFGGRYEQMICARCLRSSGGLNVSEVSVEDFVDITNHVWNGETIIHNDVPHMSEWMMNIDEGEEHAEGQHSNFHDICMEFDDLDGFEADGRSCAWKRWSNSCVREKCFEERC